MLFHRQSTTKPRLGHRATDGMLKINCSQGPNFTFTALPALLTAEFTQAHQNIGLNDSMWVKERESKAQRVAHFSAEWSHFSQWFCGSLSCFHFCQPCFPSPPAAMLVVQHLVGTWAAPQGAALCLCHIGRRWITPATASTITLENSDVSSVSPTLSSSPANLWAQRGLPLPAHISTYWSAESFREPSTVTTARPPKAALSNCFQQQQRFLFQTLRFYSACNYLHLLELFQRTEQKYLLSCPQVILLKHSS